MGPIKNISLYYIRYFLIYVVLNCLHFFIQPILEDRAEINK